MSDGPIVKDVLYYSFWATALFLGIIVGGTIAYLLWRILDMLIEILQFLQGHVNGH